MMYATKIKMRPGCGNSTNLLEIDQIYIEGAKKPGYYSKEIIHDTVKENPGCIKVKRGAEPSLVHAISSRGEKYVRSEPNDTSNDNLLKLPKE